MSQTTADKPVCNPTKQCLSSENIQSMSSGSKQSPVIITIQSSSSPGKLKRLASPSVSLKDVPRASIAIATPQILKEAVSQKAVSVSCNAENDSLKLRLKLAPSNSPIAQSNKTLTPVTKSNDPKTPANPAGSTSADRRTIVVSPVSTKPTQVKANSEVQVPKPIGSKSAQSVDAAVTPAPQSTKATPLTETVKNANKDSGNVSSDKLNPRKRRSEVESLTMQTEVHNKRHADVPNTSKSVNSADETKSVVSLTTSTTASKCKPTASSSTKPNAVPDSNASSAARSADRSGIKASNEQVASKKSENRIATGKTAASVSSGEKRPSLSVKTGDAQAQKATVAAPVVNEKTKVTSSDSTSAAATSKTTKTTTKSHPAKPANEATAITTRAEAGDKDKLVHDGNATSRSAAATSTKKRKDCDGDEQGIAGEAKKAKDGDDGGSEPFSAVAQSGGIIVSTRMRFGLSRRQSVNRLHSNLDYRKAYNASK